MQINSPWKKNEKATHGQQTFAVSFNRKTVFLSIIMQRDLFKMFICVLLHCIEDKIYWLHLVKEFFSFLRKSYSNISQVELAIVPLKSFVPMESLPGLWCPSTKPLFQLLMFAVCVERSGQDHWAVGRRATFQRYFIQGYGQIYVKGKDSTESNRMNAIYQRLKIS